VLGLYLRNIVTIIKSRVMSLAEHVARSGRRKRHIGFSCGNLREKTNWKTKAKMEG
jgi:hypothetical protein